MAATLSEIQDAYSDNADFEEVGSLTKARAFATACIRLMGELPASQSDQGSSLAMGLPQIQAMLVRAQAYIKANDTSSAATSRVRFLTFSEGFRR